MQFKSENADSCRCVFYHWNFKKNLMIKHFFSLYTNNLTSFDYWNLYWIIRQGAMWSHYWDEIQDQITKCFSDVLMSYQWEIEFCYIGSKIRDLIWNLQQNHSSFCDTSNMCTINFLFSNLVPRVSWPSDNEEDTFRHINKPTYPGNKVVNLVTTWKLNHGR